jgi:hypothetical protein
MPQKNICIVRAIWSQGFDDETVNTNEELRAWNKADPYLIVMVLTYVPACGIICNMD